MKRILHLQTLKPLARAVIMARTKPGPAPKQEPVIPRTLNSLNLLKDIVILDGRHRVAASVRDAIEGSNSITCLGGAQVNRKKLEDTIPRWGELDPATDEPDEIVQLFEEWRTHLESLEHGVSGIRVAKQNTQTVSSRV